MKDTGLYQQLLGIESPWRVSVVNLSIADKRVVVEVELKPQEWADPTDPTRRAHVHGWTDRQWCHLDSCGFETLIQARVPQLKYASGQVEELLVAWAERYARITRAMEGFVLALLAACPNMKQVCELTGTPSMRSCCAGSNAASSGVRPSRLRIWDLTRRALSAGTAT